MNRHIAYVYGIVCHLMFLAAVGSMAWSIYHGLSTGIVELEGRNAWLWRVFLVFQFPLIHSFLLGRKGRKVLAKLAPQSVGTDLAPTTYVIVGSLQLILTFVFWSPSHAVVWEATGALKIVMSVVWGASWLLLLRSMYDSGLALQTGYLGWAAVAKGERPMYPRFSDQGTFSFCRQPIYLAFLLILWTAPTVTYDSLGLCAVWSVYLILAPLLKERRYLGYYGDAFRDYQKRVPYYLPWVGRLFLTKRI